MTAESRARERAEKMTEQEAARFAAVAQPTDAAVQAILDTLFTQFPDSEDAIVSGAMTAIVRFGVQRMQQANPVRVIRALDAGLYFASYVRRAANILLARPAKPN